ncbi:hypothetical protein HK104_005352, partial [Borealophlyctis nickersoniae]
MADQLQSLKDALISNVAVEEKVEVNQRHLIDKILARYSAEFTVFREVGVLAVWEEDIGGEEGDGCGHDSLLQNSNDAFATSVEITFKTNAATLTPTLFGKPLPQVTAVTYKNDGRVFQDEDWARLRKIAEGNPDEQKRLTHHYLTGDMLYTKRGPVPPASASSWTSFFLHLRDTIPIPSIPDFGRFIATSLGFTANLKKVKVFVDDHCVLHFDKKIAEPKPLEFDKGSYNLQSPNGIFRLKDVNVRSIQ